MQNILVAGGAGFIGSNFVRYVLDKYPDYRVVVYDKLTYAGNLDNLKDVADNPRYTFIKGDICDETLVDQVMREYQIDTIVNFAADTHVDRSLMEPDEFVKTDVYGTYVLLEAAREFGLERYHQISSVAGDTPLLVRDEQSGEISLRPIASLDDEPLDQFSVLTLTSDFQVDFRRMRHLISHDADEIYEIVFNGGGRVRATSSHSVYIFEEGGQIVAKPSSQLREGDLMVTFVGDVGKEKKAPHVFDLRALFVDYNTEWMDDSLARRRTILRALTEGREPTVVAQKIGTPTFYRIAQELADGGYLERESGIYQVTALGVINAWHSLDDIHWDLTQRQLHIPAETLEVTPLLMEVFGLYLAEGHASHTPRELKNRSVTFTIGRSETEALDKLVTCAREVFDIEPYVHERESTYQVRYSSYWVHALFGQFGATAESKRLPSWIWTQPREYIEAFFRGYEGDAGIKEDGQRCYTTINRELAESLIWLARLNDINCRLSRRVTQQIAGQKPPNVTVTRQRVCWDIAVSAEHYHPDQRERWRTPMARCIPTQTVVNTLGCHQHRGVKIAHKQLVSKDKAQALAATFEEIPKDLEILLRSPIGVAKIKAIRQIEEPVMVYDVSVPGNERFFGGNVPCLLHNTDEVYGEIAAGYSSLETDALVTRSPYSASKAGGDLMCYAYFISFGVPVTITRGSNNIGPFQYPEKVVPLFITNAIDDIPLPLYGDGLQMRDYQYVLDHCEGIDVVLHKGKVGEVYNLGTGVETRNIDMAKLILELLDKPESLIQHVRDRPGHDRRYSLNCDKIKALGWRSRHTFEQALVQTVRWYVDNEWWWRKIKSGEYWEYYRKQYEGRELETSPC